MLTTRLFGYLLGQRTMTDYTKISDEELFSLYEHFSEQYNLAADEIVNKIGRAHV